MTDLFGKNLLCNGLAYIILYSAQIPQSISELNKKLLSPAWEATVTALYVSLWIYRVLTDILLIHGANKKDRRMMLHWLVWDLGDSVVRLLLLLHLLADPKDLVIVFIIFCFVLKMVAWSHVRKVYRQIGERNRIITLAV